MEQRAYELVDEEFADFVKNNREDLEAMELDQVRFASEFLACKRVTTFFNIKLVAKTAGGEGYFYHFLTDKFDKVYVYYDVD